MRLPVILLFVIILPLDLCSQDWMNDNIIWRETRTENQGATLTTSFRTWATESINDTTYRRIHRATCSVAPPADLFSCHLRTEGSQVYVRIENEEYLIYDFGLQVGDFFNPQVCINYDDWVFIEEDYMLEAVEVAEQNIDGVDRTVISFDSSNPFISDLTWIEGLGSNKGLFSGPELCVIDLFSEMTCVTVNDQEVYENPNFDLCCLYTLNTSATADSEYEEILIYPNPVSKDGILTVGENVEIEQLAIFSSDGKLIHEWRDTEANNYELAELNLRNGLYLLLLTAESRTFHHRLIVR